MAVEIEAKMKVDGFDAVRQRLAACGAARLGSVLETNTFYDTAERALLAADKGLRLRHTRDDQSGREESILTYKGPQQKGALKAREEAEVKVDDGARAALLLRSLGYEPTISFQKRRESWELEGCKIELDEVPLLGRFIEIEGPDEATVMRVRERLGLADHPLIRTGYITMLARELKQRGDERRSITF